MSKKQLLIGWMVTFLSPALLFGAWRYVPYPGALLAAGAVIGAYIGFILYEHAYFRSSLDKKVVKEQIAVALLLLVLFSFSV